MEGAVGRHRSGEMVKIFDKIALVLVYSSHVDFTVCIQFWDAFELFCSVFEATASFASRVGLRQSRCDIV